MQPEPFSGDRPRGHAGERLPERLLRVRWIPASHHQEVPTVCSLVGVCAVGFLSNEK